MNIIAEIEKKVQNKEKILNDIKRLESLQLSEHLTIKEIDLLDKEIRKLNLSISKQEKQSFEFVEKFISKYDLDTKLVESARYSYLYEYFIVENEITMFAAPPATGKSLMAIGLSNHALENSYKIIYFDGDNGITTLKDRKIHKLKEKYQSSFKYIHETKAKKSEMLSIINKLTTSDLNNVFIIFDSIKNFIDGDRDKNKDVSKVMEVLKKLRRQGATVLFLHHTNKPQKDISLTYAGSSAWQEDTSNAFILSKNEYKKTFIFTLIKKRVGELKEISFVYDNDTHKITETDLIEAKETELYLNTKESILNYIKSSKNKPIYSDLMNHLKENGFNNKDKNNYVIQNEKNRLWKTTKLKENNKDLYELIDTSNISKISQISKTTNINTNTQEV